MSRGGARSCTEPSLTASIRLVVVEIVVIIYSTHRLYCARNHLLSCKKKNSREAETILDTKLSATKVQYQRHILRSNSEFRPPRNSEPPEPAPSDALCPHLVSGIGSSHRVTINYKDAITSTYYIHPPHNKVPSTTTTPSSFSASYLPLST